MNGGKANTNTPFAGARRSSAGGKEYAGIKQLLEEVSYEKEHYFMDGGFGGSYAGVSVACGYFRKRRCRNGGMFSSVFAVNPLYSVLIGTFVERTSGTYGAFRLFRLCCSL